MKSANQEWRIAINIVLKSMAFALIVRVDTF
jgi:hypothetical protein